MSSNNDTEKPGQGSNPNTAAGIVDSDKVRIRSTADVDGVLNQKNLSNEDGAKLKIKAETY